MWMCACELGVHACKQCVYVVLLHLTFLALWQTVLTNQILVMLTKARLFLVTRREVDIPLISPSPLHWNL